MRLLRSILAAAAVALAPGAALAQWSDLPEGDSKILIDAQRLGMVRSQTKLGAGSANTRVEFSVATNGQKGSWVSVYYAEAHPGTSFRLGDTDPKSVAKAFSIYDGKSPAFERNGRTAHPLGSVRYVVAKLPDRECMLMTMHSGAGGGDRGSDNSRKIIYINFCPPKGEPATLEAAQQVLAAINARG